ncbi:concanavalin A-like lectin/glucanase domain-containing protein [Sordaria brevicollis]|uniref:Crh-like protein n=1 Tax=Sordaria brevicollis TaxID=83679 RepID=A0AAE0PKJ5_SORBR|nr:concanavalin A-like lectin/glucanase domain-containing protein [Sordaria brevicollis]
MQIKTITALAFASLVSAQTFTECNPTKKTCPNDKAVGKEIIEIDFTKGKDTFFKNMIGTTINYDDKLGAVYTIKKETDAPTVASSRFIFFGQVDVTVRAAFGKGVITSFVLQSDDLDEIDWEWIGSDHKQVQTNYFSQGCTETYDRGGFSTVSDPQNEWHTYTIKWTPTQLDWIIDGQVVRTLKNDGQKGCSAYPQTPMQIKLGTWVAGRKDAPQGTIEWAGGLTDFNEGPFDGYYKSIRIQDFMGGDGVTGPKDASEYQYTDKSGTWQSIKVISGTSTSGDETTTKAPSKTGTATSTATTLSTVPASSASSAADSSISSLPIDSTLNNNGTTSTGDAAEATESGEIVTGGAGKLAMSIASLGAALFAGVMLL